MALIIVMRSSLAARPFPPMATVIHRETAGAKVPFGPEQWVGPCTKQYVMQTWCTHE